MTSRKRQAKQKASSQRKPSSVPARKRLAEDNPPAYLLDHLNSYRKENGKKYLRSWKKSTTALLQECNKERELAKNRPKPKIQIRKPSTEASVQKAMALRNSGTYSEQPVKVKIPKRPTSWKKDAIITGIFYKRPLKGGRNPYQIYKVGMTLGQAVAAGVLPRDIPNDIKFGRISVDC